MFDFRIHNAFIIIFLITGCNNKEKLIPSKVTVNTNRVVFGKTKNQIEIDLNKKLLEEDYSIGDKNENSYRIHYNVNQNIDGLLIFKFNDENILNEVFCIYTLSKNIEPKILSELCFIDSNIKNLYKDTIINAMTYIDYEYDSSILPVEPDKIHITFIERINN